jgi:aminoglycoside phosphotransferase family enzyme/predicted kinase
MNAVSPVSAASSLKTDRHGDLSEVFAWLEAGAGSGAPADRVIETHAASIFLIGDHAYKAKKAVDLGYLDFSTAEKRAAAIRRELEFNRAVTPDIYQAVETIVRRPDGGLGFSGAGKPVETVLRMRRFDPEAVLAHSPDRVCGDFAEALGRQLAGFHAGAAVRWGGAGALEYVIASNAQHLRDLAPVLGVEAVEGLIAATQGEFEKRKFELNARGRAGQLRRCHGDLHLGNILEENGRAVLFDCIEFNDKLSEIDVLYDLAFLLMDLAFRGQTAGANRVLNGYLDDAARRSSHAFTGLSALPLFLSIRAAVRCHVTAQQGDPVTARAYLQAAQRHLRWPRPTLQAVGGLSGSGKSTVARALAPKVGAAPGAVILRSDEIRKRLWGVAPHDALPREAYVPGESERVYGRMMQEAAQLLEAGRAVVLDAVFLKPKEREAAEAVAKTTGAPFLGVWLEAPIRLRKARLQSRVGDASDADVAVLEDQVRRDPGPMTWKRVDASN